MAQAYNHTTQEAEARVQDHSGQYSFKKERNPGMVIHAYNPSTQVEKFQQLSSSLGYIASLTST